MKTTAKLIAYCIWFGVVLLLSVYHFWPFELILKLWGSARFSETILAAILFWATLSILWLGFIYVLSWLPIWFMKRQDLNSARLMAKVATFLITLLVCLILSVTVWQVYFPQNIYNCTDDNMLGFLRPGDWVHGNYVTVHKVVPSLSMSEPDTIKEGWSVGKLWFAWYSFILASAAISGSFTFLFFRSRKSKIPQVISP